VSAHPTSYADIIAQLRKAYDGSAAARDSSEKEDWKLPERTAFLGRLRNERKTRLLEIGAGTGQDSAFFRDQGLDVLATDLSPEMVAHCRAKGLTAHAIDVMNLSFAPGSFDAAYSFNSLLHVPSADLPAALARIRSVLIPGALVYIGTYGGDSFEGVLPNDWHDPPRFFCLRTDDEWLRATASQFELVDFHVVTLGTKHFQALTLRTPREHRSV
jgi:SAM-dependent methyltransferase